MVSKCNACGKYMSTLDVANICCSRCNKSMHRACVGVATDVNLPRWVCPECKIKEPRSNMDNTPVKGDEPKLSVSGNKKSKKLVESGHGEEVSVPIPNVTASELRDMIDEMRLTRHEVTLLRQELSDMKEMVRTCDSRVEKLEAIVHSLLEDGGVGKQNDAVTQKIQSLEECVTLLQMNLDNRDQELLLNDVELTGIPEANNENPIHIVLTCATKLGLQLEERDLVSCRRVGGVRQAGARPRPLAVRLARRDLRAQLLRAARVRRQLNTEDLGLTSQPCTFYVNERLTKKNRDIFRKARLTGRSLGWRFVWTRDGRIYARKESGAHAHRICTETDIKQVFGIKPDYIKDTVVI